MFKEFENETVVFIGLDKYDLDSIPLGIGKLKNVEELIISQDSVMGWTIYPPPSAMAKPYFNSLLQTAIRLSQNLV